MGELFYRFLMSYDRHKAGLKKQDGRNILSVLLSDESCLFWDKVQEENNSLLSVLGFLFSDSGLSVVGFSEPTNRELVDC